jgi:toxin HigB-1
MAIAIKSFADAHTKALFETGKSVRWNSVGRVAVRKLVQIDSATGLDDLRIPPGNRLEALKGDRRGQHSIRICDQWRAVFRWENDGAYDVGIVGCH